MKDAVFEPVEEGGEEGGDVEFGGVEQRGKVEGKGDFRTGVDGVGRGERGVGLAASEGGEVVAFPAFDLGAEDAEESFGEVVMTANVEFDAVAGFKPVERAPDFPAEDLAGPLSGRKAAEGLKGCVENRKVGGMSVGGMVGVDDFGSRGEENGFEVGDEG